MSFFASAGGRCFRGGVTSSSSSMLRLWQRTISRHSCCMSENPSHFRNQQNPNNPNNPKPKQAPWLLLSSPASPQYGYLYNLTFEDEDEDEELKLKLKLKLEREIELPCRSSLELEEHIFIGSSEGFLISIGVAPSPSIHLFNPLGTSRSGSHLFATLPPPPSPPPPTPMYLGRPFLILKMWTTHCKTVEVDQCFKNLYKTKAILSPSLDTIVLLPYRPALIAFPHLYSKPVFAPLHSSSSSSLWTEICPGYDLPLYEGIFHKGLLHALGSDGRFYILDLKSNRSVATLPDPILGERNLRSSLVESPDGNDLFLVYRDIEPDYYPHPDYPWEDPNTFEVFKLLYTCNENKKKKAASSWAKVKNIGDLAFFIGSRSSSLSIDVSNRHLFPSLKPNSIYFADSWGFTDENLEPDYFTEAGACTMEDEKTHYIELRDGNQRQLNWPPPLWYMPTPAL